MVPEAFRAPWRRPVTANGKSARDLPAPDPRSARRSAAASRRQAPRRRAVGRSAVRRGLERVAATYEVFALGGPISILAVRNVVQRAPRGTH